MVLVLSLRLMSFSLSLVIETQTFSHSVSLLRLTSFQSQSPHWDSDIFRLGLVVETQTFSVLVSSLRLRHFQSRSRWLKSGLTNPCDFALFSLVLILYYGYNVVNRGRLGERCKMSSSRKWKALNCSQNNFIHAKGKTRVALFGTWVVAEPSLFGTMTKNILVAQHTLFGASTNNIWHFRNYFFKIHFATHDKIILPVYSLNWPELGTGFHNLGT